MRYEIRYRCPFVDCTEHCSKSFIKKHIENFHNDLKSKPIKIHKCYQPYCKVETEKRIDMRAHLQKIHEIKDGSQSVHLLQRLKQL